MVVGAVAVHGKPQTHIAELGSFGGVTVPVRPGVTVPGGVEIDGKAKVPTMCKSTQDSRTLTQDMGIIPQPSGRCLHPLLALHRSVPLDMREKISHEGGRELD